MTSNLVAPIALKNAVDPIFIGIRNDSGQIKLDESITDSTPTLVFSAEPGSTVEVYDNALLLGKASEIEKGIFDYTTNSLSTGVHSFIAKVTSVSEVYVFNVDTVPPDIPIIDKIEDDLGNAVKKSTNDTTPSFTIFSEKNSIVKVYNRSELLGTAKEITDGVFQFITPELKLGDYSFTAKAIDAAENESVPSISIPVTIESKFIISEENLQKETSATKNDDVFAISSGAYSHVIRDFAKGDKLVFFQDAILNLIRDNSKTDTELSISASDPETGGTLIITLTGIDAAVDNAIFNIPSFQTQFSNSISFIN